MIKLIRRFLAYIKTTRYMRDAARQKKWLVIAYDSGEVHVVPIADQITHEACGECVCGPGVDVIETEHGDAWRYVHMSLDGREAREQ